MAEDVKPGRTKVCTGKMEQGQGQMALSTIGEKFHKNREKDKVSSIGHASGLRSSQPAGPGVATLLGQLSSRLGLGS